MGKMGVKMRYDKSIISQNKGFSYYFVTDLIFSFQSLTEGTGTKGEI